MEPENPDALTLSALHQADRSYRPFPDFATWQPFTDQDQAPWNAVVQRLHQLREKASKEALRDAVTVALRAAAIDTGAIEGLYQVDRGFTMSVALQTAAWEHSMGEKGEQVKSLFAAQLQAYEIVLDAAIQRVPLTEAWIRHLHEVICAPETRYRVLTPQGWQNHELVLGRYKTQANHVVLKDGSVHPYCPVDRVSDEMHRLVLALSDPAFESAHPVLQASYAHYALVVAHPFPDGNGRVARALASLFYFRALSIPFVLFADQKPAYLDALQNADGGDPRPFILFFRERGIDTLNNFNEQLQNAQLSGTLNGALEALNGALGRRLGLAPRELDAVAVRLEGHLAAAIKSQLSNLRIPDDVKASASHQTVDIDLPSQYRNILSKLKEIIKLTLTSSFPSTIEIHQYFRVLIAKDSSQYYAFRLEDPQRPDDPLDVRLDEAYPQISTSFSTRLDEWVKRQLITALSKLSTGVQQALNRLAR